MAHPLYVNAGDSPNVITGVAASPGTVQGTAKVLLTLRETSNLRPGDILVCEIVVFSPTWRAIFETVSGVVTDSGTVLSHCADMARDCGIPAVLNTHVGTSVIRDGMTVTVDGDKGLVRIDAASKKS